MPNAHSIIIISCTAQFVAKVLLLRIWPTTGVFYLAWVGMPDLQLGTLVSGLHHLVYVLDKAGFSTSDTAVSWCISLHRVHFQATLPQHSENSICSHNMPGHLTKTDSFCWRNQLDYELVPWCQYECSQLPLCIEAHNEHDKSWTPFPLLDHQLNVFRSIDVKCLGKKNCCRIQF